MTSKAFRAAIVLGVAATFAAASFSGIRATAQTSNPHKSTTQVYVAHLHPVNAKVTKLQTSGEARFTVDGDRLTINITVHHAPPDIVHWQHLHGFKDGHDASCPTSAADTNHDGVIDVIETEPMSGTTMVPFDDDPVAMQVAQGTYPKAVANGTYRYHKVVSLKAVEAAFDKAFPGQHLDLSRRVVMIHGVSSSKLPASVASLGTIPAAVTLPIACGKIERAAR